MLDLQKLKQMAENAADLTQEAREASERDRDYYDEHQWTPEEVNILKARKQPIPTSSRIKRKVDAMIGLEQRMRTDPKAFPRNPNDNEVAQVATKALVFVDDNTRFDAKRSMAFENMIIEGYGGVEVVAEEKRGKVEVAINRLRWEEIFFDPHSREKDFSDASYMGTQKWMDLDKAETMLSGLWQGDPEQLTEMLQASMSSSQTGETFEDRPFHANTYRWADKRQRRVRVAQMYYRNKGVWHLAVYCGGGEILNVESPYHDEDGKPTNPMHLMTGYIDRENRRYGLVRSMISPTDAINKRDSKLLHQLNSRQTVHVKGAVESVAKLKKELASPDGTVEIDIEAFEDARRVGMKPFDILPQSDQVAGQFSLLQESKNEIDMIGPNPSLIGQTQGDASGRAIMAQQQAGMAELAPLYDSLRDWTLRVYRAVWERIRQFWTDERWIRITDEATQEMNWIGVNVPTGQFMQVIDMQTGQPVIQPQMQNVIAEMDVDILIEDTPDHVTLQHEQFEQLSQMAAQGIPIPPEMIIEASTLKNKDRMLEMMKRQRAQQTQAAAAAQQAEIQREDMKVKAKAAHDAAEAQKTQVETFQMARGLR